MNSSSIKVYSFTDPNTYWTFAWEDSLKVETVLAQIGDKLKTKDLTLHSRTKSSGDGHAYKVLQPSDSLYELFEKYRKKRKPFDLYVEVGSAGDPRTPRLPHVDITEASIIPSLHYGDTPYPDTRARSFSATNFESKRSFLKNPIRLSKSFSAAPLQWSATPLRTVPSSTFTNTPTPKTAPNIPQFPLPPSPPTESVFSPRSAIELHQPPVPLIQPLSPSRRHNGVLMIHSSEIEYDPHQILGSGAQGVVYHAKWNSRDVIFKKLVQVHHTDHHHRQLFLKELEVWRNIQHRNSVCLYGAVDDSGKLGYVMEFCPHGNLQTHMKQGLLLGPMKSIDLACSISNIIATLHDSSIAHRDIKSSNIMLDNEFQPKLGDFGLSRIISTMQASATNFAGTPTHMAPEQFQDGEKHDPLKADVYSFGMLLYEIATSKAPFRGRVLEIQLKVVQGERPVIPKNAPPGLEENERKSWWKIVELCWAQDPLTRPVMRDVAIMLSELQRVMFERIKGFCCRAHKANMHDFFLSYRVASESNIVHQLYEKMHQAKRKSGESVKVFLDAKCLPDAEDWQKSFLYGLHHTKIIIPIVSVAGLAHFQKAHEENDNVLLEYEQMLSLLTMQKGKVKVFPLFVGAFPNAKDYPDKPHKTTGKNIQETLNRILRLQGRQISAESIEEVIPSLLEKLDELDAEANTSLTLVPPARGVEPPAYVYIQIEGEARRDESVEVNRFTTMENLRKLIATELDGFDFEYKFLHHEGSRPSVLSSKQEVSWTVQSVMDLNFNITVRKVTSTN